MRFDLPGEYVLDLEIDGVRLASLSHPIVANADRIFGDPDDCLMQVGSVNFLPWSTVSVNSR